MKKAIEHLLKKILKTAGLKRIPPSDRNKFVWFKELNINTVLDIGANAGQFAIEINGFLPSAHIYSFEPLKDIYIKLLKNTKRIPAIKAFNMALGESCGTMRIYRNNFSAASSMLDLADLTKDAFPFTKDTVGEEIFVSTLDDMVDTDIDVKKEVLLKMDVQGYEDKVIAGGKNTLGMTSVVLVEVCFKELYKGQMLFDGLRMKLGEFGFNFEGIIYTSLHPKTGMPLFADAVFVKPTGRNK